MHYNCLIIDDEEPLAESTAEYFNIFGVSAAAVFDAEGCRRFLGENSADIILLDINLDKTSGFDLCRELRTKTQVPILFISARQSDDDILLALGIGGDDYIRKPYTPVSYTHLENRRVPLRVDKKDVQLLSAKSHRRKFWEDHRDMVRQFFHDRDGQA